MGPAAPAARPGVAPTPVQGLHLVIRVAQPIQTEQVILQESAQGERAERERAQSAAAAAAVFSCALSVCN